MNNQDYESIKQYYWNVLIRDMADRELDPYTAFSFAFDRAYSIGKEKDLISQDEIDKAAEGYASFYKGRKCSSYIVERECCRAFKDGANFALGKKIGISDFYDAEDTVISGWVCRDNNSLNAQVLIGDKPKRTGFNYWENKSADCITLPKDLFPDLTWESDPEEVEIILKRKKK